MLPVALPQLLPLHDDGIRRARDRADIRFNKYLRNDQLRPATLDIRIGKTFVFDEEVRMRAFKKKGGPLSQGDITRRNAKRYPDSKNEPILIPPGAFVEIEIYDDIQVNSNRYQVEIDLRSSIGRRGLTLLNKMIYTDQKQQYVSLWNRNPNPIILHGQERFAQLFFYANDDSIPHDGYTVTDPKEAQEIANVISNGKLNTVDSLLNFTLGENIYEFKKNFGPIDTFKHYNENELYISYSLSPGEEATFHPRTTYITQLEPKINLPSNIGIQILPQTPYDQISGLCKPNLELLFLELHCANAKWLDPGYEGYATAQPFNTKIATSTKRGQPVALARIFKYYTSVNRPYGSEELNSHYQGSFGSIARS